MPCFPLSVFYIHIADIFRCPKYQANHIGVGIFISHHFVDYKALCRKVTGNIQFFRLAQHKACHNFIDFTAKIPKRSMLLVQVSGIHHILSGRNTCQKFPHIRRRRLPVIIQTDHNISRHVPEACHQRRMLPEIPGQGNPRHIVIFFTKPPDYLQGIVRRTVIYQYYFINIIGQSCHRRADFFHHMGQRQFRPVTGNDKTHLIHDNPPGD